MNGKRDYFRELTGQIKKDVFRRTKHPETRDLLFKQTHSKYPLRSLGSGIDGELFISEEERIDHCHILGTTGEGKSKFIEYLIREDIRRGNGVCLLDPTDRAETAYNILKFCIEQGHEKVCLIDPHLEKITCIQPFHSKYKEATVANVMDTIRILFNSKDAAETPVIQKYLPAIVNVLHNAKMTLHEAKYFMEYKRSGFRRKQILEASGEFDRHRLILEESFDTYFRFDKDIGSSTRRLEPFFDSRLDLMFAAPGIDFAKMISEGWVILVNLYAGLGFEPIHSRLLGTTVINEIIFALDRLRKNDWKGVYYLYVDEAGRYANRNLADLLAYKRKSGLRVTIAHQYFAQFEDKYILDAVKNLTKIKIMFHTPGYQDRLEMIKALGYGGDIPHTMATYANQNLPKQQAIIKVGKDSPKRIKIPDVPDPDIKYDVSNFLNNEWNYTRPQIYEIINNRFNNQRYARPQTKNTRTSHARTAPDRRSNRQTGVPDKRTAGNKWQSVSENVPVGTKHADADGKGQGH
ncbi:MAG: type IV secretory system conjugative DNA transfer family protein [Pyrinomonadaceae bacterium]|nr:type IV secretory system conjugative DNA transfer family protein [Pyrinomonadaceae bacterium]